MAAQQFNSENFGEEVLKSKGPVLVDFYADWCGPCKMMAPVLDEMASEDNDWKIGKVNVDESSDLAGKYGVQSIPTLIFFKDGEEVDRALGFQSKEALKAKMDELAK
ncbi:thioredoxin [Candidatus Peregrinibacteria bacterium]|nr:thioredoxin [Candidatus Peregrinibacteria bacterium]